MSREAGETLNGETAANTPPPVKLPRVSNKGNKNDLLRSRLSGYFWLFTLKFWEAHRPINNTLSLYE